MNPHARASANTLQLQDMVNAIRAVLGKDPLYPRLDAVRVYGDAMPDFSAHAPKHRRTRIGIEGVYEALPNIPLEERQRGAVIRDSIARQIERDRYYARLRTEANNGD